MMWAFGCFFLLFGSENITNPAISIAWGIKYCLIIKFSPIPPSNTEKNIPFDEKIILTKAEAKIAPIFPVFWKAFLSDEPSCFVALKMSPWT